MSVSDEFRRLLLHAAQRLGEEEHVVANAFEKLYDISIDGKVRKFAMKDRASYLMASTTAQLVMEMTAKFLTDGETDS